MFSWFFGKHTKRIEEDTKKGFSSVRDDMEKIGKWIKHLDEGDKQLFEIINELKQGMSTVKDEMAEIRESISLAVEQQQNKQLFKKLPVVGKQTAVEAVQEGVQTAVQTGNYYEILKSLSGSERLVVFALLNTENGMKLSYEDLALLLGKERATLRGQLNAIKQKSDGLIEEIIEKNGKKRVFIPEETKEKLLKYAKVRVRGSKK
jgi:hypothetical protein